MLKRKKFFRRFSWKGNLSVQQKRNHLLEYCDKKASSRSDADKD